MVSRRRLATVVAALVVLAVSTACSGETDASAKARWAAGYELQCRKAISNDAGLVRYASTYCTCVAERYIGKFSAVQIPLTLVSKPLRDAARAIRNECGLIASMQDEYDRLMAALGAHSDLAVTAYLTRDFIGIDIRGREESARQLLSRMRSRQKAGFEITTVLSANTNGKRMNVDRKSLEGAVKTVNGKTSVIETLTLFRDTWIDSDGTWLLQRSTADRIDTFVDNRRVSQLEASGAARP